MFANKRILITGGAGTIGKELAKQLVDYNCAEIIIFSRNEVAQVEMKREFPSLTYAIGDIRDKHAVKKTCKNIDVLYHLAAIKHVTTCENQPIEAVKTNILGTQNIIANYNKKLVFMSTDKAVNPSCVYGYTKAVAEKMAFLAGGVCIRSGNVWASSGSVVPYFISQIRLKNKITLTNGEMTRFFILRKDLVKFMLEVTESKPEGIYYPTDMRSFRMRDIAEELIEEYGNGDTQIIEIGARDGEKMHESICAEIHNKDSIIYSNECVSDRKYIKEFIHDIS